MSRRINNVSSNTRIVENGTYRLNFYGGCRQSFLAVWDSMDIKPAGEVLLSFSGNYGAAPASMDLSTHINAFSASQPLPFIDLDVSNLPSGGSFTFYGFS